MSFQEYFPIWDRLNIEQQRRLLGSLSFQTAQRGTVLHDGNSRSAGLFLIQSGQLRAYVLSDEGREITIYRLFDRDFCLFSASCIIRGIHFEIIVQAEKETRFWRIPPDVYRDLMAQSAPVANYTNELMASRLSEVVGRMEQLMARRMDRRVAAFLLQESAIEGSCTLRITHEAIANHLGSHREVVTRTLRDFQSAGIVRLSRGMVTLLDQEKLKALRG